MYSSTTESDPPYKIEVFEDYLYVLTYKKSQLLKLHKFGYVPSGSPSDAQPVYTGLERVNAIVVIQENKMFKNRKQLPVVGDIQCLKPTV